MAAKPPPRAKTRTEAKAPAGHAPVILITGVEAARKNAEAAALVEKHVAADWADFDAETLDGAAATAEHALSGVATVPMGEGRRVVLVRNTEQMEPDEQRRLAGGLARIPGSGLLILLTGTPVVDDGKTKRTSVVLTELANAVKKTGQVLDFALPRAEDVRGWLLAEAKRLGKAIAPDALAMLSTLPGQDLLRVGSELAKAAAHAGNAPTIGAHDVEATLSRTPDDVIFKLCDAVGARRTAEALGHVSTLFRGGGRPESVAPRALVLLARQVRLLAQFKYLQGKGLAGRGAGALPPEAAALLPGDGAAATLANPRMAWMADKYVGQARNFTGTELVERMERLLEADLRLKGITVGGDSPQAVLQRLIVELC